MNEFVPDLILNREHPVGRFATVYLDGQKAVRCFEARIKWASFESPTFGELIVGAGNITLADDRRTVIHKPRLGEFDLDGLWVRFVCGKVLVKLDEEGQQELARWKGVMGQISDDEYDRNDAAIKAGGAFNPDSGRYL